MVKTEEIDDNYEEENNNNGSEIVNEGYFLYKSEYKSHALSG